jgi:uncharacterized membrane protein
MSDWYYAADGEQKGPTNEAELKSFFAAGRLPADALVWTEGMANWAPANSVPAFTFRPAPEPAKVQPQLAPAPAPVPAPAVKVVAASPAVNNPESTKPVNFAGLLGKPEALEVDPEDAEKNKAYGILAYFFFFCFVPIIVANDSPYAKYHANQGLVLFIAEVATFLVTGALVLMPFIWYLVYFLHLAMFFVFGALAIFGIINAAAGKCVPLPLLGGIKLLR